MTEENSAKTEPETTTTGRTAKPKKLRGLVVEDLELAQEIEGVCEATGLEKSSVLGMLLVPVRGKVAATVRRSLTDSLKDL